MSDKLIRELRERRDNTLDKVRKEDAKKRLSKGFNTARTNLSKFCNPDDFREYGQFAVAAQRQRRDYQELQTKTAADGVIIGIAPVNQDLIEADTFEVALVINDYSVLAGTQGYYHHLKLDRILAVASKQSLPLIMLTEGGGGRPSDTDITTVNSGLQCTTFSRWASLAGEVPRIAVNNGYCFAGNAALFGAADITIATKSSTIGMAGPAMIEGGGLGQFNPLEIGPIDVQAKNGVVDIVAENEDHAIQLAKQCLGFFQGKSKVWNAPDSAVLSSILPDDRRYAYDMRALISGIVDVDSFVELNQQYGGAIILGFARLEGNTVGLMASNCKVLGGAIDVDSAIKTERFLTLCNQFSIPILSLCDTPGFMVGPEHEKLGAVRYLSELFKIGAKLSVPFVAVVVRKCYGLGAQAMLSGSTLNPSYTLSWPQGEFGAMGLEGAVKLGFQKQLDAISSRGERQKMYDKLLAQQYENGKALEVASVLEIDAVIEPLDTRKVLIQSFDF